MSKLRFLANPAIIFSLIAIGCAEQPAAKQPKTEPIKVAVQSRKKAAPETERTPENRITGTASWNTGKRTEPEPKALEKDAKYTGNVSQAGGNSITVSVNGQSKTFRTDENTQIYRSGDPRFFPYPNGVDGIGTGTQVTVVAFTKNGQEIARLVEVFARGNNNNNN